MFDSYLIGLLDVSIIIYVLCLCTNFQGPISINTDKKKLFSEREVTSI